MRSAILVGIFTLFHFTATADAVLIPTGIEVWPNPRTDGSVPNAIDTNIGTNSFLTPAFTATPNSVGLEINSSTPTWISGYKASKFADTDGTATAPDEMDLQIFYTTDTTGALSARTWLPVTGLNSPAGPEQIVAAAVSGNTVDNDIDNKGATGGFYLLNFDDVQATAIRILFARDPGDTEQFTHYLTNEFQIVEGVPEPSSLFLILTGVALAFVRRRRGVRQ